MSLGKVTDGDHDRDQLAFELPRARAAWPAWTLVAVLTVMGVVQLARGTGDDIEGVRGLALSTAALARGEWWTVLTQMVVQQNFPAQVFAIGVVAVLGVMTLGARDPRWMGGWRTLAVYLLCGLGAAGVHLLSGSQPSLTGVWPALLGLGMFYWVSGRAAGLGRPDDGASAHGVKPRDRHAEGARAATQWLFLWLSASNVSVQEKVSFPFVIELSWQSGLAIVVGGAALVYGIEAWAPKPIRWLVFVVLHGAYLLLAVLFLSAILRENLLPLEALAAGAAMGLVLGAAERGWKRDGKAAV